MNATMNPLTDRQSAVMACCADFYARNDQLPPYSVIAEHFGWSSLNSAVEMMDALRRKGLVAKNEVGKFRFTDAGRAYITARAVES